MIQINLHTHTFRCHHAEGKDEEYILKALEAGFTEIGFSDHAPFVPEKGCRQSQYRIYAEDVADYIGSVRKLKEKYSDRIRIHIGFEMEYYPEYFDSMLKTVRDAGAEYLLLGQHFIASELDGGSYSGIPTEAPEFLQRYCGLLTEGLSTGAFTYPAHPDLVNFNGDPAIYDKVVRNLIRKVTELGYPLELNRLGFFEKRNYPSDRFWRIAGEEGAHCVIGLDAHAPEVYTDKVTVERIEEYLDRFGLAPETPTVRPL